MTPKEAASHLRLPERTLAQWRYLGKGPAYHKIGVHVRYDELDLEAWIATQRHVTKEVA